jgi:putative PIG3 family NAD(P)H quinone oxidoreductase
MTGDSMMQAVVMNGSGGPDVLTVGQVPRPIPKSGEVLIRVHASGINRPDVLQRMGKYPPPPDASPLLGLEVSGVIVDGDAQAMKEAGFESGDAVCALVAGGGYAEYCTAPVAQCLPLPRDYTHVQAASLPETAFTVWSNVFDRVGLQAGETILIQGGSSGIGVMAIQMAKAAGAAVIVTVGSDDKAQACLALGANHAVNYKTQDFATECLALTQGKGVNVILDMVAGAYIEREVSCLAEDGRLAVIAVQGGIQSSFDAGLLLRRRLTVTGSTLRPRSAAFKGRIAQSLRKKVWPWLADGQVKPVIHQVFDPIQAAQAHALMESNQHIGKLIIQWC